MVVPPWQHRGSKRCTIWVFPKIVGFPPKSSILIAFSLINHPFWGTTILNFTEQTTNITNIFKLNADKPTKNLRDVETARIYCSENPIEYFQNLQLSISWFRDFANLRTLGVLVASRWSPISQPNLVHRTVSPWRPFERQGGGAIFAWRQRGSITQWPFWGGLKWPFQGPNDLYLGNQKVTLKKLVNHLFEKENHIIILIQNPSFWGSMLDFQRCTSCCV